MRKFNLAFTQVISLSLVSAGGASRVLVTAPSDRAWSLCGSLIRAGIRSIHAPTVSLRACDANSADSYELEDAALRLSDYDMLTLFNEDATSHFVDTLIRLADGAPEIAAHMLTVSEVNVAAVPRAAMKLRQILGRASDVIASTHSASALVRMLVNLDLHAGKKLLCPLPSVSGIEEYFDEKILLKTLEERARNVKVVRSCQALVTKRKFLDAELGWLADGRIDFLVITDSLEAWALATLLNDAEKEQLRRQVDEDRCMSLVVVGDDIQENIATTLNLRNVLAVPDDAERDENIVRKILEREAELIRESNTLILS